MVFLSGIPQATDKISDSQGQLLANNQQLDTSFGIDHTAFSVNSNIGLHKKVSYLQQSGDPAAAANTVLEYCKLSNAVNELFMRRASGDGSTVIQLSNKQGDPVTGGNNSNGKTFLPGGIILQWGRVDSTSTGGGSPQGQIVFPTPFPNVCFSVVANVADTPLADTPAISIVSIIKTQFNFTSALSIINGKKLIFFAVGN